MLIIQIGAQITQPIR